MMTDDDARLLRLFVQAFTAFDDLRIGTVIPVDGEVTPLLTAPWDERGWASWRPIADTVPQDALAELYARIPGPLPPLYERLILSYRWAEVDVGRLRLLGNLPPRLNGLASAITRDNGLFDALTPAAVVQFGRGPDIDYDPIGFDLKSRCADGDCPVVQFDHEEILSNRRLRQVAVLADSFRELVTLVIRDAREKRPSE